MKALTGDVHGGSEADEEFRINLESDFGGEDEKVHFGVDLRFLSVDTQLWSRSGERRRERDSVAG